MKKLLPFLLLILSMSALKAQNVAYVQDLLNQYGIPYNVVTSFDTGGGASGTIPVNQIGMRPTVTFNKFSDLSIGLYTNSEYQHPYDGQTYPQSHWTLLINGPYAYQAAYGEQTGAQLYFKVKAAGGLKPVQIKSDGTRIMIFCSDGRSYRFNVDSGYYNGQNSLMFTAGGGDI